MKERDYIEERHFEPINILIIFLLAIAAALFVIASKKTINLDDAEFQMLSILVGLAFIISAYFFLRPKKVRTPLNTPMRIIEKTIPGPSPDPIIKEVIKYKDKPVPKIIEKVVEKEVEKIVEKEIPGKTKIALIEVERKKEPKKPKSKYVGSSYNEKFHLRTCRFAGAIKPEYLVEEDKRKYFTLRGYKPCGACNPDKN